MEVSWRVEAVRNDRWVQRYGAPEEVEKEDAERGQYPHPELYGQPKEKTTNYQPKAEPLEEGGDEEVAFGRRS